MLMNLVIAWSVVTIILVALSIHRSILVMREEDTLFLSDAERSEASQYAEVIQRLKRLEVVLKSFSFASGGLMLVIAAVWVYQGLYR